MLCEYGSSIEMKQSTTQSIHEYAIPVHASATKYGGKRREEREREEKQKTKKMEKIVGQDQCIRTLISS